MFKAPLGPEHHNFLSQIAALGPGVYPLIALAIFLEGEAVIYGVMFLAFQGVISLPIVLPIIVVSVLITDFISYQVGKYGPRYLPRIANFYGRLTAPMDGRLEKLSLTVYLVSKFTYGFHRAVLIRSGMIGIPFKKLFKINLITSFVWITTIFGLAFASWKSFTYIHKSFRYVEIALLIGIIGMLLISHLVSHFTKMKLLDNTPKK